MQIDHRAAGIARIDRSVGLDEVFIILDSQSAASRCADDSHRGRVVHSERIADREDHVADLQFRRIADAPASADPIASIFRTATSVFGSVPISFAVNSRLSLKSTLMSDAPSIT